MSVCEKPFMVNSYIQRCTSLMTIFVAFKKFCYIIIRMVEYNMLYVKSQYFGLTTALKFEFYFRIRIQAECGRNS